MGYNISLSAKISLLSQEEQRKFNREVNDFEECPDALLFLGLDPYEPDSEQLKEIIYERDYNHRRN